MILLHKWDSALWCVFQSCNCWEWIASYWEALLRIWCWLKVNILSFTESRLGTRLQKPYLITAVPNELQSCTRCILTVWMQMFAASVVAGSQSAATFSETVGEVFSSEHIHFKDNITAQPGIKDSVTQLKISDKKKQLSHQTSDSTPSVWYTLRRILFWSSYPQCLHHADLPWVGCTGKFIISAFFFFIYNLVCANNLLVDKSKCYFALILGI